MTPFTLFRHVFCALVLGLGGVAVPAQDMQGAAQVFTKGNITTDRSEAEAILKVQAEALRISESQLGKTHRETVIQLHILAGTNVALGRQSDAAAYVKRAIDIPFQPGTLCYADKMIECRNRINEEQEKRLSVKVQSMNFSAEVLGPEHIETALREYDLGETYREAGQIDEGVKWQAHALEIFEVKGVGREYGYQARTLVALRETTISKNRIPEIELLIGRAQKLAERIKADKKQEEDEALSAMLERRKKLFPKIPPVPPSRCNDDSEDLGDMDLLFNKHASASPLNVTPTKNGVEKDANALKAAELKYGERSTEAATQMSALADLYLKSQKLIEALELHSRALKIREILLGTSHPDTRNSIIAMATTYSAMGLHNEALEYGKRSLQDAKSIFGKSSNEVLRSLNLLSSLYVNLGSYAEALDATQQAIKIVDANPSDSKLSLEASSNLALVYWRLGQINEALQLYDRVLHEGVKVYGSKHPFIAENLINASLIYVSKGSCHRAIVYSQRALAINEEIFGESSLETSESLHALVSAYVQSGLASRALPFAQRSVEIRESLLDKGHQSIGIALSMLGIVFSDLHRYQDALNSFQTALSIVNVNLGNDHPDTAASWGNVAYALATLNQYEAAALAGKRSVNITQSLRGKYSQLDEGRSAVYVDQFHLRYVRLADILGKVDRLSEAQQVLDMLKETQQFDFVRRSGDADPRKSRVGYTSSEQSWMHRYEEIAEKVAALGTEDRALKRIPSQELTPQQKSRQKALAADLAVAQQAFEDYLVHMREELAFKGPARAMEVAETSLQALRTTQSLIRSLGDDVVLLQYYVTDDQVGMLLTTSGTQLARHSEVKAAELNRQIFALNGQMRDPKANPLAASQALYQLLLAPVARDLETAGAKTVMLSLDGSLRYVPFGALHDGKEYALQRWRLPLYTSVVRDKLRDIASPQWQAAGLGVTRAMGEFAALPAVRGEIASIVRVQGQRAGMMPGEIYLDETFNAARLKDVGQRPFQLMHVASHFRFSPGTEINSFLLLGDGTHLTLGDLRTQNYRFDNVELLTLSACETGLGGGRNEKGQEIEGFGVIAQQQGAKAVLATLWPVADQSTATLMADMYRRRQEQHLSKIEALRQAQISLLSQSKYAHPFYWAPFVLMGNWK